MKEGKVRGTEKVQRGNKIGGRAKQLSGHPAKSFVPKKRNPEDGRPTKKKTPTTCQKERGGKRDQCV